MALLLRTMAEVPRAPRPPGSRIAPLIVRRATLRRLPAALLAVFVLLWAPASRSAEENPTGVDHDILDRLLQKHVHGSGVNYAGLQRDVEPLDRYLAQVAEATLKNASEDQRLVLFINAYNAFAMRLIVRHYPDIDSIRDLTNPWGSRQWIVSGTSYSLDELEHGVLRGQHGDPRIHFAIHCTSVSGPRLRPHAFRAETLNSQLDTATREFIRSHRVTLAAKEGITGRTRWILRTSRVFKWYRKDFHPSVPEFIARYAAPKTAETIRRNLKRTTVKFNDYDWSLNDYLE